MQATCGLLAFVGAMLLVSSSWAQPVAIGSKVDELSFHDQRLELRSLSDLESFDTLVLVFIDGTCAAVTDALPRLEGLVREFRDRSVALVAVNSNTREDVVDAAAHALENGLTFAVVKDFDQSVKAKLGVTRTPEAVVIDRDRKLRYRGSIIAASGSEADRPREALREAVLAVVEGKDVALSTSSADGCLIRRPRSPRGRGITYHRHVAPILAKHCVSCHRDRGDAPFGLLKFPEVRANAAKIAAVAATGRMPPVLHDARVLGFVGRSRLSRKERELLRGWAVGGAVEGDAGAASVSREPGEEGRPRSAVSSAVVEELPGVVPVDTWISRLELLRPENAPPRVYRLQMSTPGGRESWEVVAPFVVGATRFSFGDGRGFLIRGGSRLRLAPELLGARITWARTEAPARRSGWRELRFDPAASAPARSWSSRTSRVRFDRSVELTTILPELGAEVRDLVLVAKLPDGSERVLSRVVAHDPRWIETYIASEPAALAAGAIIEARLRPVPATFGGRESRLEIGSVLLGYRELESVLAPPKSRGL